MAVSIPKVLTTDRLINQLQNNIIAGLQPVTSNQQNQGTLLKGVQLQVGSNSISHGLGVALTGWTLARIRASASIYDDQDNNKTPSTTLVLVSSAKVKVDLYVW